MHNCLSIANCIIDTFKVLKRRDITIMELLKYQFFCYGWYLAQSEESLFNAAIKAYPLGPVIEEIYKGFDDQYRDNYIVIKEHDSGNKNEISSNIKSFIKEIMKKYCYQSPIELSYITHLADTPWTEVLVEKGVFSDISDDLIRNYYKILAKENRIC